MAKANKFRLWSFTGFTLLCIACLAIAVQSLSLIYAWPYLVNGQLLDSDSYTWLGHVQRLIESGDWYDHTQPRANWPFGELQHSTRPFDAILWLGSLVLTPFVGADAALFWTGAASSSVLYLVLVSTVIWAGTRMFGLAQGAIAALLLLMQFSVLAYALPARADHHVLIMVLVTACLGWTARTITAGPSRVLPLVAGGIAGLGLWVSPEFLLTIAASFAGLTWVWVRRGGSRGRDALLFATGMLIAVGASLLVEYQPGQFPDPRYDRLSSVHLLMALFAIAFWACAAFLEGLAIRRSLKVSWWTRLLFSIWGAGVAISLFNFLFPDFFAGPAAAMDPRARAILLDSVMETRGLLGATAPVLALYLWPVALALPVTSYRLYTGWADASADLWFYLATVLVVFTTAALFMLRFSPFACIVSGIIVADAAVRMIRTPSSSAAGSVRPSRLPILAGSGGVLLCLVGIWLSTSIAGASLAQIPVCHQRLKALSEFLRTSAPADQEPLVIVTMEDMGPEILYRTRHRVIATPSISNPDGAVALFRVFDSRDDSGIQELMAQRGINRILLCTAPPYNALNADDPRLIGRLLRGEVPDWLVPVALPDELAAVYKFFRVTEPAELALSFRKPAADSGLPPSN